MSQPIWMIYGAYGYTGELIAREAAKRGLQPILAGRRAEPLERLAEDLGGNLAPELALPHRAFGLEDPSEVKVALADVAAVLHCAGPFSRTSRPMVDACLDTGTHYLDITGEIGVFESILRRDTAAREASVVLLPGVGFDVVPGDCTAARLAAALTDATHLELAFSMQGGSASRGTLKTMIQALPEVGAERRESKIVRIPIAHDAKQIELGCGRRWVMTIPWGDVSTAFYTTGIPNIRTYAGAPPKTIRRLRRLAPLLPLAGAKPIKSLLEWWVGQTVTGPDETARARARTYLWGQVSNPAGDIRTTTLETPDGYSFTVTAALESMARVLNGAVEPGAWTPAGAFGPGFISELPDVVVGPVVDSDDAHRQLHPRA